MCGIAGFISNNPEYNGYDIVKRMLSRMSYRGPDQTGVGSFGNCTLGMVRLSIIDTEDHEIPIRDRGGQRAIVYNGEIYNFHEIKESLGDGIEFKTKSDAEVALYSYCKNGISSFNAFNGMYAFAIWDGTKNELVAVRDKTGEKPLYYCKTKDFFAFASEMKGLFEVIEPVYNEDALSYIAYEFTCGSETLFKDIFCLEPGEFLSFSDDRICVRSYWKIWDHLIDVPSDLKKMKAEISELICDAILLRTRNCAHQYGVLVSGGLDSALVACITRPDYLFTCHYDLGEDFDELRYAKLVAKHINRELNIVEPVPEDFKRNEYNIAYHLDTPCTWTSFSWWMLLETVSRHIKVVLTGDGADELFGGYNRYLLIYNDEQVRKLASLKQYSYLIDKYYGSFTDRYARLVNRCENKNDERIQKYLIEKMELYYGKMSGDVIQSMGVADFYTTMQVLLQMSDRMCMAFSVENRSPFLDYRLIQYAFSMSSEFKIHQGVTKWILKEIARDFVPKEIVDRVDKRGFSAPINRWFDLEKYGKYDRSYYKGMAFETWRKIFLENSVKGGDASIPFRLNERFRLAGK
jgi:asparagine synthase (glutamine-hydrolysing)